MNNVKNKSVLYPITDFDASYFIRHNDEFVIITSKNCSRKDWDNTIYIRDQFKVHTLAECENKLTVTDISEAKEYIDKCGYTHDHVEDYFDSKRGRDIYIYVCRVIKRMSVDLEDISTENNKLNQTFVYINHIIESGDS